MNRILLPALIIVLGLLAVRCQFVNVAYGPPPTPQPTSLWTGVNFWALSGETLNGVPQTDSTCNMGGTRQSRLDVLIAHGVKNVRVGAFQGYAELNGQRTFAQLDDTFGKLGGNGMQAIAVLANEWDRCDGPGTQYIKPCGWFDTGYKQTTYNGQTHVQSYRDYVSAVVSRYASNTTIRVWEVMNEPRGYGCNATCNGTAHSCILHDFFVDIVGVIKAAAPNAEISLGGNGDGWDFTTENQIVGVTQTTFHDYTEPTNPLPTWVASKIDIAKNTLHKPIYAGEEGIDCNSQGIDCRDSNCGPGPLPPCPPGSCNESDQALKMEQKANAYINRGAIGYLDWAFNYTTGIGSCEHDFGPNSPKLDIPADLVAP